MVKLHEHSTHSQALSRGLGTGGGVTGCPMACNSRILSTLFLVAVCLPITSQYVAMPMSIPTVGIHGSAGRPGFRGGVSRRRVGQLPGGVMCGSTVGEEKGEILDFV